MFAGEVPATRRGPAIDRIGINVRVLKRHFERHRQTTPSFCNVIVGDIEIGLARRRRRITILGLKILTRLKQQRREAVKQRFMPIIPRRDALRAVEKVVGDRFIAVNVKEEINAGFRAFFSRTRKTSGLFSIDVLRHARLRSVPAALVRKCPRLAPSRFMHGMM